MTKLSHEEYTAKKGTYSDLGFRTVFWQLEGGAENGGREPTGDLVLRAG